MVGNVNSSRHSSIAPKQQAVCTYRDLLPVASIRYAQPENIYPPGTGRFYRLLIQPLANYFQASGRVTLRAHLYSAKGHMPKVVPVTVTCTTADPQSLRYPVLEDIIAGGAFQPYIHDIFVKRDRRRSTLFRIFFKRHVLLHPNRQLGIHGDVVVMRVATRNRDSVVNLRSSDHHLVDAILCE